MWQETSPTEKAKFFFFASLSSSLEKDVGSTLPGLRFVAVPVGRSGWPVLCPGVPPVFSGRFSVTSEADPGIRFSRAPTQEPSSFGQVPPAAAMPDGCLTASFSRLLACVDVLGLRFSLPRGVAAPTSPTVAAAANSVGGDVAASGVPSVAAAAVRTSRFVRGQGRSLCRSRLLKLRTSPACRQTATAMR